MEIYTDGGYHPKYKKAAYAYILKTKDTYQEFYGFSEAKNSREAELIAAELALKNAQENEITLFTDYQGLIDGFETKKNSEEFAGIVEAVGSKNVKMVHMNGHRDDNNVIECDKMINGLWKEFRRLEKQKN